MKFVYKYLLKIYNYLIFYKYQRRINDLIRSGLKVGKNVTIEPTVMIDTNYPYLIEIGDNCSLAQGVKLLAHDATVFKFLGGHTRLGRIKINDNVFIGTNSIILPGVQIGPNALIAAGSLVNKDIAPNSCVAGVPARFYKKFDEYLNEMKESIDRARVFSFDQLHDKNSSEYIDVISDVRDAIEKQPVFSKKKTDDYLFTLNT